MTDTNYLIPNQTALSSDCLYNLKPSSVHARSYRASIPSSNKSLFIPLDVGIFYVPEEEEILILIHNKHIYV
jgi:hypothetical protein